MNQLFLGLAGLFGATGVALGAFGAHALRGRVSDDLLATFETATRYHLIHAVALAVVAVALHAGLVQPGIGRWAGWGFVAGMLLFAGSLYLLVFTGQRWLGAVTPLGGVALIAAWTCLAVAAWRP